MAQHATSGFSPLPFGEGVAVGSSPIAARFTNKAIKRTLYVPLLVNQVYQSVFFIKKNMHEGKLKYNTADDVRINSTYDTST